MVRSDIDTINVYVDSPIPVKELADNKFVFTPNKEGEFHSYCSFYCTEAQQDICLLP